MIWLVMFLNNDPLMNDMDDVKNDICALEFYLQDKKDKEEHCPNLKWDQPKLEKYKKDPKSHLPEECKEESD